MSGSSRACSTVPGDVHLAAFNFDMGPGYQFYLAAEGAAATARVVSTAGDCTPGGAMGKGVFATEDGSATELNADYEATTGETPVMCRDVHPDDPAYCPPGTPVGHNVSIPTLDEPVQEEPAVESFRFALTAESTPGVGDPGAVPVHVVDVHGPSRFALEPTLDGSGPVLYSRSESFPNVRIPVFRAGPATASESVGFSLTPAGSSPASAGKDFVVPTSSQLSFASGERMKPIVIQLLNDQLVEQSETFQVALTSDAVSPSSTMVTIADNDSDHQAPVTRFHHPRNRKTYPRGDYRLREMHVFFGDEGGSSVVRVEMALRKRLRNGSCAWWRGDGFRSGSCWSKRWVSMRHDGFDLYYRRFPSLRPTQRTRVRSYMAWSRGFDGAGNVEARFTAGRNANKFWIKRS